VAKSLHVVVLAAGKGTRMRSARPKVLHRLAGRPLIEHILSTTNQLDPASTTLVVGHGGDDVKAALAEWSGLEFVTQSPQLGTGHALLQAEPVLAGKSGTVLLLYADVPLLESSTLSRLVEAHHATKASITVLTTEPADPYGYGRIVRDGSNRVTRIVEERDASRDERRIREINSGIYCFALAPLFDGLNHLAADNAQEEYYLTDLVALYYRQRLAVETLRLDTPDELVGVNSRVDLAKVSALMRSRKNRELMLAGVTLEDPATTYIDDGVTVGRDTVIGPGVRLEGETSIGVNCEVRAGARLTAAVVGDGVTVLDRSIVVKSTIEAGASVGPFAHVRPGSMVREGARVGNFVELKKTTLGRGSKANHLAYLGDAVIGENVNVGAGTITCNYDGRKKHQTIIEDGVFIGSNSQLVAPVRIGRGAYVGAGSTITKDVPAGSLAIARGRQQNKEGWAERQAERFEDS
jgi:bifunctional UDP-N-acetylglucosamine pyrophosphorylase/glucosamine-1-phosphate N-acetyltransferase